MLVKIWVMDFIEHVALNKTSFDLRRISTRRNDWWFRLEIVTKLFCHETIVNIHMNNFGPIIENKLTFLFSKAKRTYAIKNC